MLPSKNISIHQESTAMKVVVLAIVGVFGFFTLSKLTNSEFAQSLPVVDSNDDMAVYSLAFVDDTNALPRVAVLPIKTLGDKSNYSILQEVLKGAIDNKITAIDGITVVALSSSANIDNRINDYKILKDTFGIDYAIALSLTSYGNDYKLNVSLIQVGTGLVLHSASYTLEYSGEDEVFNLTGAIATKVTLMTANKLNLSVQSLPESGENYEFYAKYEISKKIAAPLRYETTKRSAKLLREVIEDEPYYIPAYSELLGLFSYQVIFT